MSIDKSLKTGSALARHRNVLTRAERIEKLKDEDRWQDGQSPFGLVKVAHRKAKVGGRTKKAEEAAAAAAAEGQTPPEGATAGQEKK